MWVEERKLPPVNDEAIQRSATVIPMLSSEWQAKQDPDNAELRSENDKCRYDGKFVANPQVVGAWKAVSLVSNLEEFNPDKPLNANRAPIKQIKLGDDGLTNLATLIWSGDMLMNLDRYEALKITLRSIGGADYLVIEAGGFSEKHPSGWNPQLIVMKRE